jgi:hypothetical protein
MPVVFADSLRASQFSATNGVVMRTVTTGECPVMAVNNVLVVALVPASAIIDSIRIAADDLGTTGTVHVGLYKLTNNNGVIPSGASLADGVLTAIDDDYFGTSIDLATAATAFTEYKYEATPTDIDKVTKSIRDLFQTACAGVNQVAIGLKFTAASTAVGTVSTVVQFVD